MKIIRVLKKNGKVLILLALALLALVSAFLPYGTYVYKKHTYGMDAFDFLSGRMIAGGKVEIAAQSYMALLIIGIVLAAAAVVLLLLKKNKISGILSAVAGVVVIVCPIVLIYNFNSLMQRVKVTSVGYGAYISLAAGILLFLFAVYLLYSCKTINMLDLMILPMLAYLIINNYIPMSGIIIAFKKLDYSAGIFKSPWVGLDNFKFLFQTNDIWYIIRNTLVYNIAFIILNNFFGIAVGIMLSEIFSRKFQKVAQTLILLPQIISWVIVSYMVYGFLSTNTGWVNNTLLPLFGYSGSKIAFYGTRVYWPFILTFLAVWKGLGYNSVIYLSSIVGIDINLYEAATVDGCSKMQQIRYITLPLLRPTVITLVIMALGHIMNSNFGLFYQATQNSGALYKVTQTLDVYIYRAIMETQNLSMGSAAAALQSVVGFALIIAANAVIRKLDSSSALF